MGTGDIGRRRCHPVIIILSRFGSFAYFFGQVPEHHGGEARLFANGRQSEREQVRPRQGPMYWVGGVLVSGTTMAMLWSLPMGVPADLLDVVGHHHVLSYQNGHFQRLMPWPASDTWRGPVCPV